MSKILIIAEKPSVATDLARVLGKMPEFGKFEKKKDYFENENAYISSAIGHLVELKMPLTPEGKKLPWGIKHLPVLPTEFDLQPIERSESRYKLLVRLIKKKDVSIVVNACDAGREGELIFRYVLKLADLKKDFEIKRMWMQSMTDDSIKDAWANLRGEEEMSAGDFLKVVRARAKELHIDADMLKRPVNVGFSGGEKKRNEILQMAMLEPKMCILDETDSGLDVDAMKLVASGVNALRSEGRGFLVITHYQRLLDHIKPDVVHIMAEGRIVKTGGPELALEVENNGYADILAEVA